MRTRLLGMYQGRCNCGAESQEFVGSNCRRETTSSIISHQRINRMVCVIHLWRHNPIKLFSRYQSFFSTSVCSEENSWMKFN
mmetsp:Transcript_2937/g.11214  ORF Transcript_2937/g.11214 Transcript_2937/m.11214 type:complete len:82 (-) Transcript_2937:1531-1776(-)